MGEILMILFIYLLLFGAKGIPSIAQTLGKAMYQFRNAAKDVQEEILKSADEVRKEARVPLDQLDDFPPPQKPAPTPDGETPSLNDNSKEDLISKG
jgi:sec-independent protein translocase protein TatA